MAYKLSCSAACRILVHWSGVEHATSELKGRFLTTGPPEKSLCRVLVVACRIFASCDIFHCSTWTLFVLHGFGSCGPWAVEHAGSVAAACRLSCSLVCGMLVPWPGIKPMPPCIARWILNHWTTREIPLRVFIINKCWLLSNAFSVSLSMIIFL